MKAFHRETSFCKDDQNPEHRSIPGFWETVFSCLPRLPR